MEKSENELIAEFMGYKLIGVWPTGKYWEDGHGTHGIKSNEFKYGTSWDWLMPVVQKITPIAKQLGQQAWFDVTYRLVEVDINNVHKKVVEFIRWYNNSQTEALNK